MSDANFESNDSFDSQEANVGANSVDSVEEKKGGILEMNLWDVLMIISFVCVLAASFFLFLELRTFSDWPASSPWNVSEAKTQ